jgi:hypothetical protein
MKRALVAAAVCAAAAALLAPTASATAPAGDVHVVADGEAVRLPNGTVLSLTKDDVCEQYVLSEPAHCESLHEISQRRNFHGIIDSDTPLSLSTYIGPGRPARVIDQVNGGRWHEGTIYTLPGRPGWSVYTSVLRPDQHITSFREVLLDAKGRTLDEFAFTHHKKPAAAGR